MRTIRRAPWRNSSRPRKSKPFSYGYGGSSARIAAEYVFHVLAKANATGVPFQSGAPALNALLGHHVDINVGPVAEVHPMIRQGTVRALAVTGPRRAEALPDVPTLEELGYAGHRHQRLDRTARAGKDAARNLRQVERRRRTTSSPSRTSTSACACSATSPIGAPFAEAPAFLKKQIDTWGQLIRATGITAE